FSVEEVCFTVEQQFTRLQKTVEKARTRVEALLEEEQKQTQRQAEGIQLHWLCRVGENKLSLKRAELKKVTQNGTKD
ncbi:hypothetical protein XENOCAPTIV_008001, partial [Xenoophorus captivus]